MTPLEEKARELCEIPKADAPPEENARIQAWFRDWQRGLVDLPLWVRDPGRAPPSAREMK